MRRAEELEREHDAWQREQAILITEADRAGLLALGENVPLVWHAGTTTASDRKQILRLVIRNVFVDQKRERGRVWVKIIWQTGAASEH